MKRFALLGFVAVLAAGCSGGDHKTLGGYGISLSLPHGWYGLSAPGQLQAADFPLAKASSPRPSGRACAEATST